jgi:arylsulfatase A-like enzyme
VFRSATDSLEDLAANAPFFLWIDSFDPHEPWDPPPSYADEYCPDYEGQDFIMPGAASEGQPAEPAELERIKALYFGECTFVDRRVGHLLEEVARLKLLDDTIVMVTCDHGTQVFDHGSAGKGGGNLRAYNTRIMWSVRHPDGPRGDHVSGLVQSHDLAPTALALLGIEYECDGEDVWPLVTGERDAIRDHIVIGWAGWSDGAAQGFAAARDDRWSYTVPCGGDDVTGTLYDLQQDPEEDRDMAAEHSGVVSLQRRRIERVMGQPLPGRFEEVCDTRAPSPYAAFLAARR